jgi:hypothetical protein
MELPEHILDNFIQESESNFLNYNRKPWLNEETVVAEAYDLYSDKEIIILDAKSNIDDIIKNSSKPWVYHYSLNLNWVLLFKGLYEKMWISDLIYESDLGDFYLKVCRLEIIFNHFDGIIEDNNKVYLVKDDVRLIQKDIRKFTLN